MIKDSETTRETFKKQKQRELAASLLIVFVALLSLCSGYLFGSVVFHYKEPVPLIVFGLVPAILGGLIGYKAIKFICPYCGKSFYGNWDMGWWRKKCFHCHGSKL